MRAGELERLRRLRRCDVEFRPRLLGRPRQRGHVLEGVELAAVGGVLLRQQQIDLLEALAKARLRFIGRDAEAAELVRQERARKADVEPSAGDRVEHGDLARELERMIEHRQHRAGDQAHRLRALRQRGEKDDRVRAVAAVAGEIVLDGAGMGEAERLGFLRDRQRFRKVVGRALVGMIDAGKNCTPNCICTVLPPCPPSRLGSRRGETL